MMGRKYPWKGQLTFARQGGDSLFPARLITSISRGKLPDLTLDVTFTPDEAEGSECLRMLGTLGSSGIEGGSAGGKLTPGTSRAINVALLMADESAENGDSATLPLGQGYAVARRKGKNLLNWAGLLADGTSFTASHLVGRRSETLHETLLHVPLYKATGSLQSSFQLTEGTEGSAFLEGSAYWSKQAQGERIKTRSYKDGFAPLTLRGLGYTYLKPAPGEMVLGLEAGVENVSLTLDNGGLLDRQSQTFTLTTQGRAKVETGTLNSLAGTLSVKPATGLISGTFTLKNPHPVTGAKPPELIRKTKFTGLIVTHPEVNAGVGHFNLAELPDEFGEKLTTTPLQSGGVRLAVPLNNRLGGY